jgi:hypothetical protein
MLTPPARQMVLAANTIVIMAGIFLVFGGGYVAAAAIAALPDDLGAVINSRIAILALAFVTLVIIIMWATIYERR